MNPLEIPNPARSRARRRLVERGAGSHGWWPAVCGATLAVALLAAPAALRAADIKIGYIDSSRIFQEYTEAKESQARFDRLVQNWRDDATEKEKQVKQLRDQVRDQSPILSALKRQEMEEALQRATSDYEKFIQDIWGPNGKAAQENERATGDVVTQIRAAVEKVAGTRGLELVLDSAGGVIIYADRTMDITSLVIQELNTRASAGTKK